MNQTAITGREEDVVYHRPASGPLQARLYHPMRGAPVAGMVSVHGGRWCAETRLSNAAIDRRLAAAGVFVMALDFRMPPVAQYPVPVADIHLAIRWLKTHAGEYGIDAGTVGGIGTSSGGHQLLLNALKATDPRFAAEPLPAGSATDASLAFMVACWPVSDPAARYRHALAEQMTAHVEGHHAYWPDEAAMSEGSPQRIVVEGEATHLPPLLVIQGSADTALTPGMSERFSEAYRSAGGAVELRNFDDQPHTFITKAPDAPASQAALDAIVDFVRSRAQAARSA